MTKPPEDNPNEPVSTFRPESADDGAATSYDSPQPFAPDPRKPFAPDPPPPEPSLDASVSFDATADSVVPALSGTDFASAPPPSPPPMLFQAYMQPPHRRPVRIPHLGHLLLLLALLLGALAVLGVSLALASYLHLFGWQLSAKAATNIGFNLASEAVLYLVTFALSWVLFPLLWQKGYFAGLQWNGHVVIERFRLFFVIALGCFGLAGLDEYLLPGPANAPIEKMISSPAAAWTMFAFGVTMAPFFEEMFFRGFLLPALSTAGDWIAEKLWSKPVRPLDANGGPQWSLPAMAIASIATSLLFALLHAAQQGHSLGPFLLLIVISLILCAVRLTTRSLAASTLVHASYNFFIFFVELIATGGFRHFDKM